MTEPTVIPEVKSDDKKDIEMEEREQMLNAENKAQDKKSEAEGEGAKLDNKEGREVKPKKIPIGGIQMPGFFTRSKSKERCKEGEAEQQSDVEGNELLETTADSTGTQQQTRIKLPNPFRKSKLSVEEGTSDNKSGELKEKKGLLDTIRLPLVSVFPRKKKDEGLENQAAGLASMETLGDNDKSIEKNGEELKTIPLDNEKKDLEKQELETEPTCVQKLKYYKWAIIGALLFLLVVKVILIVALSGSKVSYSAPIKDGRYVEAVTSCGKVEGLLNDGAVAFRGIPYARPPVGELRFKHAQPLNNIDYCWNGTLLTHNATDTCLQILSNGTTIGKEDCLMLDVVTPYVRYDSPLPVIVLIGAENLVGGSPGKMRPSARYARSRDVLFVRPNFRMGILGFLAVKALSEDEYPKYSGNYGLSDIVQALEWVQLNIEHFGGDKDSVMLFGHRAGATLVTALAAMPGSNKLFARAWASSGGAIYPRKTLSESELENQSFLNSINCDNVTCLRQLNAEFLTNAVFDTWRKSQPDLPAKGESPEKRHEWLVLDGKILREHPATTWVKEDGLPVQLVIGTTAQASTSEKLLMKHTNWTEDLVIQHLNESFLSEKGILQEVLDLYPKTYKGLVTMISDIRTVCPLFAISTQMHDVPFYVVNQTRGAQNLADIDSDIDAILGRYEPKTPEQKRYFSEIQNLFYHFVWHGKIDQLEYGRQKVLVVSQFILPDSKYSHCDYWINKNIVLPYADLD